MYPVVTARGRSSKRYSLLPEPIVAWLALAALSGIVGNLAYDVVKAAFQRITKRRKQTRILSGGSIDLSKHITVIGPQFQRRIIWTDAELDECYRRLSEYFKSKPRELRAARRLLTGASVGAGIPHVGSNARESKTRRGRRTRACTGRHRPKGR
jgi:hypothetical protein